MPDFKCINTGAKRRDGAADFEAKGWACACRRRVESFTLQQVGTIYARVRHVYQHLAGGGGWYGAFSKRHGLRGDIMGNDPHGLFPGVFECDRAIEHRLAGCGVFHVGHKVAMPLKLKTIFGFCVTQAGLHRCLNDGE